MSLRETTKLHQNFNFLWFFKVFSGFFRVLSGFSGIFRVFSGFFGFFPGFFGFYVKKRTPFAMMNDYGLYNTGKNIDANMHDHCVCHRCHRVKVIDFYCFKSF